MLDYDYLLNQVALGIGGGVLACVAIGASIALIRVATTGVKNLLFMLGWWGGYHKDNTNIDR